MDGDDDSDERSEEQGGTNLLPHGFGRFSSIEMVFKNLGLSPLALTVVS